MGVWYPKRRPCSVAIKTSVDFIIPDFLESERDNLRELFV